MDEDHAGKPFSDLYQLRLLEEGLYFADGQNEDEVYVYGSFLQSKMSQAGVVCSDCHEPHSNSLLAQGNALCTRCHDNGRYNDEAHHHHASESPGASCVNCHMPMRTYMVVDDRHDHSFRIPEPALTQALGTPNTCNQCHLDRDAGWAATALGEWGVSVDIRADHARLLEMARASNAGVLPELLSLANDTSRPGIVRATAILESSRFPSRETLETVLTQLASPDDLIRTAAVRSLDWIPPPQRYQMLQPLISDPARAVRAEVARQLSEVPIDQVAGDAKEALERLRQEYLETLELNADMPETQINIAVLYSATGDPLKAEAAYRRSLKLSPTFTPAMLNLADLYRANGMDSRAKPLLLQAIEIAPEQAEAYHALGLLQVRAQQLNKALPNLQRAAELQTYNLRFSYVYAVALYEDGEHDRAIAVLEDALEKHPGNEQLVSALASYYQQRGNLEKLQQLMERYPR
jgi:predicted CXXCH cytochrome family protein